MSHAELAEARAHPQRTLAVLAMAATAYALAQTMVIPVIGPIQEETGVSANTAVWLLTAFLLSSSVATPVLGRLGDMVGKERVLLNSLVVFGLGSLLCAIAPHTIGLLILGRVIQGAGGAIFPLSFGIVRDELPPTRVAPSIALISTTFGIGGGAGLLLSGFFIDHLSIAWDFWFAFGFTTLSAIAVWRWVPESPVRVQTRIDYGGSLLVSLALVALLLGISEGGIAWEWTSAKLIGCVLLGLAGLVAFVVYELRFEAPLIDMRVLARRAVWSPNLAGFMVGFGMFGSYILIPQLVLAPTSTGYGFGESVTGSGLVLLPSSLVMLFTGPLASRITSRFGMRLPLVLGAASSTLAFGILVWEHDSLWKITLAGVPLGLGIGLAFAAMANLVIDAVPQDQSGVASAVNTIARSVGGAVGGQIAATLLVTQTLADGTPAESAYTNSFAVSFGAGIVTLAVCALVPRPRPRAAAAAEVAAPERVAA